MSHWIDGTFRTPTIALARLASLTATSGTIDAFVIQRSVAPILIRGSGSGSIAHQDSTAADRRAPLRCRLRDSGGNRDVKCSRCNGHSELSPSIISPAIDRSGARQRAGVGTVQLRGGLTGTDRNELQRILSHLPHIGMKWGGLLVALRLSGPELPGQIVSPTPGLTEGSQSARHGSGRRTHSSYHQAARRPKCCPSEARSPALGSDRTAGPSSTPPCPESLRHR